MVGEGSYASGIVKVLPGESEDQPDIRRQSQYICSTLPRRKSQSFSGENIPKVEDRKDSVLLATSSIAEVDDQVQSYTGIIVEDGKDYSEEAF